MRFLLIILITSLIFAEEGSIKPDLVDDRVPLLSDSSNSEIPGETSLKVEEDSIRDSLQTVDTTSVQDSLTPINSGFTLGARWGFSNSDIFSYWGKTQTTYRSDIEQLYKDLGFRFKKSNLRSPENQSIAFPVSLGYFKRISDLSSLTWGLSYAFRVQHSVFQLEEDSTEIILFEHDSRFSHQQIELFFSFQHRFNPEYLSIQGVDATGITLSTGFIPLSAMKIKSSSTDPIQNKESYSFGLGASWELGFFTEKQISNTILNRMYLNYHGSIHDRFPNHLELLSHEDPSQWRTVTYTFVDTFFELGFMFTFSKSRDRADESL